MSAQMLELFQLEVGTVPRLERDAWSVVKILWRATNEYAFPNPPRRLKPLLRWLYHLQDVQST